MDNLYLELSLGSSKEKSKDLDSVMQALNEHAEQFLELKKKTPVNNIFPFPRKT